MKNFERIAFYGFRGGKGSIGHVMLNLMNGFAKMGFAVDLLLNNPDVPELAQMDKAVKIHFLGNSAGVCRIPSLFDYLKQQKPDVLLANREPAVRVATMARKISGGRTRIAIRVGMPISIALNRRGAVKKWLRRAAIRYCYRRADHIIANDSAVAEDVAQVTGLSLQRIHVLPNPTVSDDLYRQSVETPAHPWFSDNGAPIVIGVGRLARQKDFATLIRAVALLKDRQPCRLVILGEGKERKELIALAQSLGVADITDLPGHVSNPFGFMARSNLFVLSSAWEGSPNVLIQAIALGVPVVATDCRSGPRDILAGGRYGPLVAVGDFHALADAMFETLRRLPDREMLYRAAERFQSGPSCQKYAQVLHLSGGK